jgi:hypothetical protein
MAPIRGISNLAIDEIERVLSGIARAKAEGVTLGRPALEDSDAVKFAAVKAALSEKKGIRRIARELRTGVGTVLRIKAELAFDPLPTCEQTCKLTVAVGLRERFRLPNVSQFSIIASARRHPTLKSPGQRDRG